MLWLLGPILLGVGAVIAAELFCDEESSPPPPKRNIWDGVEDALVIGFYGPASAGKSSAIRALFGIDVKNIHPTPGSTRDVSVWDVSDTWDEDYEIYVADVPGLQDIDYTSIQKAWDFAGSVDIFVFVVNANGGVTDSVLQDLNRIRHQCRPVLVVLNKRDTIQLSQADELFRHQCATSGMDSSDFIPVAFDPHPIIAQGPMNIGKVHEWLTNVIKKQGDELLHMKHNAANPAPGWRCCGC